MHNLGGGVKPIFPMASFWEHLVTHCLPNSRTHKCQSKVTLKHIFVDILKNRLLVDFVLCLKRSVVGRQGCRQSRETGSGSKTASLTIAAHQPSFVQGCSCYSKSRNTKMENGKYKITENKPIGSHSDHRGPF